MTNEIKLKYPDTIEKYNNCPQHELIDLEESEEIHFDLFHDYYDSFFNSNAFDRLHSSKLVTSYCTPRNHFHKFYTDLTIDELVSITNSVRKFCFVDDERGTFLKISSILSEKNGPISDLGKAGKVHLNYFFKTPINEIEVYGVFGQTAHKLGDLVGNWNIEKFIKTYMYVKLLHSPSAQREKDYSMLESSCRSVPHKTEELINFAYISALFELTYLVKNIGAIYISVWKNHQPMRTTKRSSIGKLSSKGFKNK